MYTFRSLNKYPVALANANRLQLNLAKGEYLVTCPFDKNHTALNTRFCTHLAKCRRNYKDWLLEKEEPVVYVSCRYDPKHKVLPPELDLHEYVCQKDYMKSLAHVQVLYNLELRNHKGPWQYWIAPPLARETFAMLRVEPIPPTLVPEGVILWADPLVAKLVGSSRFTHATKFSMASRNSEQMQIRYRRMRSRVRAVTQIGFPRIQEENEADTEGYWNAPGDQPEFDWLQYQVMTETPSQRIPPGLSKSQRKKWIELNEMRLKTEAGFFVDLSEPVYPLSPKKDKRSRSVGTLPIIKEEDESRDEIDSGTTDSDKDNPHPLMDISSLESTDVSNETDSEKNFSGCESEESTTSGFNFERNFAMDYILTMRQKGIRSRFDLEETG